MVKILLSVVLFFSVITSFGQRNFYVNYTLTTDENEDKCWHVIPADNLLYDSFTQVGLSINKVEINDSCLVIHVFYGCGCGSVYMNLFSKWETVSDEKVLRLIPDFLDYDLCRAGCPKKISFDLSPYIQKYSKPFKLRIADYEFVIE